MSQSMPARLPLDGLGVGVTYGENNDMGIGLPIEIDKNRPLVIAHPAAGHYYHSSMNLFADTEHPFIQVLVDEYSCCPYTEQYDVYGDAPIYQRLHNTLEGYPVFKNKYVKVPHWQIHIGSEAFEYLSKAAPIDILYIDWMTWLDNFIIDDKTALADMMTHYADKIRDGGLVIFDHKHKFMGENGCRWYNHPEGVFSIGEHSTMEKVCTTEWIGDNHQNEMVTYAATVFKVHHSQDGPLADVDWSEAIRAWFWKSVPEMALTLEQVQGMIKSDDRDSLLFNLSTPSWRKWHDTWATVHADGIYYAPPYEAPVSLEIDEWPKPAYMEFLQWLSEHPTCLQKKLIKRSYKFRNENFVLNFVQGDIVELAPALYNKSAALAVRYNLQEQVVNRCPWWRPQTTALQSKEYWIPNPFRGLKWSGKDATPNLVKLLIKHAKSQAFSSNVLWVDRKSFQCKEVVTVAHGTGMMSEVMEAVEAYYDELGLDTARPVGTLELTIVHLDENDYQEEKISRDWKRLSNN